MSQCFERIQVRNCSLSQMNNTLQILQQLKTFVLHFNLSACGWKIQKVYSHCWISELKEGISVIGSLVIILKTWSKV